MHMAAKEPILAWSKRDGRSERAAYEHPLVVRYCHWINTVALFVLIASGLRIFKAFPSFGPKVPQANFLNLPASLTLGGWLGGALQWHITFAWIYVFTGIVYACYQLFTGHYRQVLFVARDVAGVWPQARHYFFFGRKPEARGAYNPLQKLAYTAAVGLGILSVLTGMVLYNPVQFSLLTSLMGGFHLARVWHFAVLCAFVLFILGHLVMVLLHGWHNFVSMLTGWKRNPEYLP
jgi:Ni/Fe-hydrogenase b-type cytochrome subunit